MIALRLAPLAPLFLCLIQVSLAIAARPNVVLIITDDQGYGDFGAHGNEVIETPNIDRMAAQSASMSNFYVCPVCSPTRACLMTGRYNYRTRCIDTYIGRSMMDPEEVTIAELLAGSGYATGIFGKWHLGDCYPMRPMDQGFEEVLIHRGGGLAQPSDPRENQRRYTDPILFHNGEQVQTEGYCTDIYFDAGLRFIEKAQRADRSFFVYLPTNAPHGPYHDVPSSLLTHYQQQDMQQIMVDPPQQPGPLESEADRLARIAAMITNVDQNVGRLFDKLDELDLTDNTLVMFLVDNGPNTRRYVGPFRGMKTEVHEGGIRSPLWLHLPGQFDAEAHPQLSAHIDLLPTILEACGVEVPAHPQLDGRSLLPILRGEAVDWPDRQVVIQSHRGDQPVRYHHFMIRQGPWKLLHPSGFGREGFTAAPQFELYNVADDPGEQHNLAPDKPEIVARLQNAYDRWFDDVGSTRPDNYAPPRIQLGTPHENPTVLTRQDWRDGSWAANSTGHWRVQVARSGRFDIELLFDAAAEDETVVLEVGEVTKSRDIEAGDKSAIFRGVELNAGDVQFEGLLESGDERRGIYQAVVRRVE